MQKDLFKEFEELEQAINAIKVANQQGQQNLKPKRPLQTKVKEVVVEEQTKQEPQRINHELSVIEQSLVPQTNSNDGGIDEGSKGDKKERKRFDIVRIVKDLTISKKKHRTQPQQEDSSIIEADFVELMEESEETTEQRFWNRQEAYRFMLQHGFGNVEATIIAKAMEQISVDEKIVKISIGGKPISVLFRLDPLDIGLSVHSGVNVLNGQVSTKTTHVLTTKKIRELLKEVYANKPLFSVFKNNKDYVNRHNERVLQSLVGINHTKIEVDFIK